MFWLSWLRSSQRCSESSQSKLRSFHCRSLAQDLPAYLIEEFLPLSDALIVHPPIVRRVRPGDARPSFFLAGSIEMGKAEDWQAKAIASLRDMASIIYNPRRPDWNSSWEQDIANPDFNVQVNWELDHIDRADFVLMYFDPATQSPITLVEFGRLSVHDPNKVLLCCPKGFWRKGNVDIICERDGITQFDTLDEMLEQARNVARIFRRK